MIVGLCSITSATTAGRETQPNLLVSQGITGDCDSPISWTIRRRASPNLRFNGSLSPMRRPQLRASRESLYRGRSSGRRPIGPATFHQLRSLDTDLSFGTFLVITDWRAAQPARSPLRYGLIKLAFLLRPALWPRMGARLIQRSTLPPKPPF